jgi:hypothetical protein
MAVAEAHPSLEDLTAFTRGTLADEALAGVEAHVAACPSCQELAAGDCGGPLVELLRRAHVRMARPSEAVTEAGVQSQTPPPLGATEVLKLGPAAADGPQVVDAVPRELAEHERYHVGRLLGVGGMGSVFEAEHRVMRRPVAVKVINRAYTANPAAVERFRREVQAAARLAHPNIVTAHDAEQAGDLHFLVMELVDGKSLACVLKERGPLPIREACAYVRQAALGLQHAHEKGMVHRDVKPDNLMLTPDGTVKVLDFGLAALTAKGGSGGLTEANVIMGTPDYMAPEQAEDSHKADIRADVYSLGCTLYHLLTGNIPYPADTSLRKVLAHRDRPVPSLRAVRPEVPKGLETVLARLLAKKPADRYQTPGEVAAALAPFAQPAPDLPRKPRRRLGALLAALLVAAGTLAGATIYRIQTDKGELVISTESDDVDVIVKQGGKVVRIIDARTDKELRLVLRSGVYQLELQGAPEGLKLNIDKVTLTRGETVLAKIERAARPQLTVVGLMHRLPWSGRSRGPYARLSPDGRYCAATAQWDASPGKRNGYRVWEVTSGKLLCELGGPRGAEGVFLFTPDGRQLVGTQGWSGHQPEVIRRDVRSGEQLAAFAVPNRVDLLDVSPDGKWLALFVAGPADWNFGNTIRLVNLTTGGEAWRVDALHEKSILDERAQITRNGKQLITLDVDRTAHISTFRFFDLATGKTVRSIEIAAQLWGSFTFLDDARQLAAVHGYLDKMEPVVDFWDAADGKLVRTVKVPMTPASRKTADTMILSDDGRFLAVNHPKDHAIRFFELDKGTELCVCERIPNPSMFRFSADSRFAACDADDGVYLFRLPDPPDGKVNP